VFIVPNSRSTAKIIYGDPGKLGKKNFQRRHMTIAKNLPGTWNNGKGRLFVHKKAEDALRKALDLCKKYEVLNEISRLGCYNHRHMRHNSNLPLSYHAFGVALDINPEYNIATKENVMNPFSYVWKEHWPDGVSLDLVSCFKEAGFSWGGDWEHYVDPMHFELVK